MKYAGVWNPGGYPFSDYLNKCAEFSVLFLSLLLNISLTG
jgi:hypothetical protein